MHGRVAVVFAAVFSGATLIAALLPVAAPPAKAQFSASQPRSNDQAAPSEKDSPSASAEPDKAAAPVIVLADDLRETIERVPVEVATLDGRAHRADMLLTHFRPAGEGPFPFVVMSHGRGPKRAEVPRYRYLRMVRFWTRRGFAVFVPTRAGYGETGQSIDPEASAGQCDRKVYTAPIKAMVAHIEAAITFAKTQPWIDGTRIVLAGQSYGGVGTVAAAGRNWPGVIAAINFAGGLGGRPATHPAEPCSGGQITRIVAEAGANSRLPMLWLYAQNDKYWGPEWPKKWAMAYEAAGGRVDMHMIGPVGEDGHELLGRGFQQWRPLIDAFMAKVGVAAPKAEKAPPATAFAPLDDDAAVPLLQDKGRIGYRAFLASDLPRAFAVGRGGAWAFRSGSNAVDQSLAKCETFAKSPCRLYAVDDAVVWTEMTATTRP